MKVTRANDIRCQSTRSTSRLFGVHRGHARGPVPGWEGAQYGTVLLLNSESYKIPGNVKCFPHVRDSCVSPNFPHFYTHNGLIRNCCVFLSGPVYVEGAKGLEFRHMELQIPILFEVPHRRPIRLAFYDTETRYELCEQTFIGTRSGDEMLCCLHQENHNLKINNSLRLVFRCLDECELWRVSIQDVTGCGWDRYRELVSDRSSISAFLEKWDVPTGYRKHMRKLLTELCVLEEQPPAETTLSIDANPSDMTYLASNALRAMEYLEKMNSPSLSVREVDMGMQDFVHDTQQQLRERVQRSKSSFSGGIDEARRKSC